MESGSYCFDLLITDVDHFSCAFAYLYVFFKEMSGQVLCPCVNWVVFVVVEWWCSLCMLDFNLLSDKMICRYFLPYYKLLLTLSIMAFAQKF